MKLVLPWPNSILRINDKSHWAKKMPFKNALKQECFLIAKSSGLSFPEGDIHFTVTFYPPNNRWDWDGMITASKALFDGVSDGWGVNDKRFRPTIKFGQPDKNHPRVEIVVD